MNRKQDQSLRRAIRSDIDVGGMTRQQIAEKHGVDQGFVHHLARLLPYHFAAERAPDQLSASMGRYRKLKVLGEEAGELVTCERMHVSKMLVGACVKRYTLANRHAHQDYMSCMGCAVGKERAEMVEVES